jgi:uncharacterized cysteine cluster protein YcgN (CxxCxxCC family)
MSKDFEHTNCPVWFSIYLKNQKYLKSKELKRIGECTHCGDCCMTVNITVDWFKEKYNIVSVSNKPCNKLDIKQHRCTDYLFRPLLCRIFPMRPSDLKWLPNCTYKFVRKSNDKG